jgi:hypothetical protein
MQNCVLTALCSIPGCLPGWHSIRASLLLALLLLLNCTAAAAVFQV